MIEPLKMAPLFVSKVWGGRRLNDRFGKSLPDDQPYGESWEVADLPEGQSKVVGGFWNGRTLGDVRAELGPALIGTRAPGERFPLLVKLLDARADLSVQVHPGAADLHRFPGAQSKDESWIILDSDDGSLLLGFREGEDVNSFRRAIAQGRAEESLQRIAVSAGDVFRLAPGTVHAICAGTALLEIQEPSDTTYRVWDYNRPGLDGLPRALHLEEALTVSKFEPYRGDGVCSRLDSDGAARVIVDVPAYRIESATVSGAMSWRISPGSPQVVHVLEGEASFDGVQVGAFETVVLPAGLGRVDVRGSAHVVLSGLSGEPLIA